MGEDQVQHIELARDYAERFNKIFNIDYFQLPKHKVGTFYYILKSKFNEIISQVLVIFHLIF